MSDQQNQEILISPIRQQSSHQRTLSHTVIQSSPSARFVQLAQPQLISQPLTQQLVPQTFGPSIVRQITQPPQIQYIVQQVPANHSECNDLITNLNIEIKRQQTDLTILFSDKEQLLRILGERDHFLLTKDSRIVDLEKYCGELTIVEQNIRSQFENAKRQFQNQQQLMELEIQKLRELLQSQDVTIDNQRQTLRLLEEQNRQIPILEEDNRNLRLLIDRKKYLQQQFQISQNYYHLN